MIDEGQRVTRLAPSPTGALHLGNAMCFLAAWLIARQRGWRVVMRLDDLDGPRVKPGLSEAVVETLAWLGLDWDGEIRRQSEAMAEYGAALGVLRDKRLIYPSRVTRGELAAWSEASAPNEGQAEAVFPAALRPSGKQLQGLIDTTPLLAADDFAWRLRVEPGDVVCADERLGDQRVDVAGEVGDFVVATKAGVPSYQLAVVVDDAAQGVTDVIRGSDLLSSTARQALVMQGLDLERQRPRYWHLPLVRGHDGRRLAKRHGDTRLTAYRQQGVSADRVRGLLAWWLGAIDVPEPISMNACYTAFDPDRLPCEDLVFRPEDDAWLTD
ncbi:MAG: tRNA glutamyl-Q(34) synthetase GluQRS [Planctomycetota bacterium]